MPESQNLDQSGRNCSTVRL